jgi:hypothetical protein
MNIRKILNNVMVGLGGLFILFLLTSIYVPPKVETVYVDKVITNTIYVDKPVLAGVSFTGLEINKIILFYRENHYDQYQKILSYYDLHTHNHQITSAIMEEALDANIPVNVAFGLAKRESGFDPYQINVNPNKSYDRGLFQLNSTSRPKWKKADYFNIQKNTHEGVSQMKWLYKKYGDDNYALAAYNSGEGSVDKKRVPFSTAIHVIEVRENERMFDLMFNKDIISHLLYVTVGKDQISLTK